MDTAASRGEGFFATTTASAGYATARGLAGAAAFSYAARLGAFGGVLSRGKRCLGKKHLDLRSLRLTLIAKKLILLYNFYKNNARQKIGLQSIANFEERIMILNPAIMEAVEQLGDRITVGDVATYAGLNINLAQQELLILATNVGAHIQVTELGEIVYLFPKDLRAILRNKFWRLRLQEWWGKIRRVLFFLIRMSFGVFLLGSITLISIVLLVITTGTMFAASDSNNSVDIDSDDGWWIRILDSLIDLFSSESKEQKKKRRQRERDTNLNGEDCKCLKLRSVVQRSSYGWHHIS